MDLVYAAADVVISRAGASSVSELCIVGKPVIFIPSPNVASAGTEAVPTPQLANIHPLHMLGNSPTPHAATRSAHLISQIV